MTHTLLFCTQITVMLLKSDNGPALSLGGVLPLYWTAFDGLGGMPAGKIEAYVQCCKNKREQWWSSRGKQQYSEAQQLFACAHIRHNSVIKLSVHFLNSLCSTCPSDLLQQCNPPGNEKLHKEASNTQIAPFGLRMQENRTVTLLVHKKFRLTFLILN